jgi:CRP-like cAMP-binding protein
MANEIIVDGHVIDHATPGDSFGARGLLYDHPHSATLRATDDVVLLALERADFLRAATGKEQSETLPDAPHDETDELSLAGGETLFTEGEDDDRFFVILDGQIEIHAAGKRRRVLAPGDGFGELAALRGVARTTTAVARTPVRLMTITGAKLRELVADYMQGHSPTTSRSGGSS